MRIYFSVSASSDASKISPSITRSYPYILFAYRLLQSSLTQHVISLTVSSLSSRNPRNHLRIRAELTTRHRHREARLLSKSPPFGTVQLQPHAITCGGSAQDKSSGGRDHSTNPVQEFSKVQDQLGEHTSISLCIRYSSSVPASGNCLHLATQSLRMCFLAQSISTATLPERFCGRIFDSLTMCMQLDCVDMEGLVENFFGPGQDRVPIVTSWMQQHELSLMERSRN